MKVHVKKGECQTPIPAIIVTIVFLSFSIGVFVSCFSYNSFMEALSEVGMLLIFALVFFAISLYFIYALFKRPKEFSAKLTKKNVENYKGRQITYMTFTAEKEKEQEEDFIPATYTCYTYGNNKLIKNKKYIIKIKEFNWKIKAVEEDNNLQSNIFKVPNMTLSSVFLAIGFIFGRLRTL